MHKFFTHLIFFITSISVNIIKASEDDRDIQNLTYPESLSILDKLKITDENVIPLTNSTYLDISRNKEATNEIFDRLPNLRTLKFCWISSFMDSYVNDDGITKLTNLTELNINSNYIITDKALIKLTQLEKLDLSINTKITDHALSHLTNLRELDLHSNYKITNSSVSYLTNLEVLLMRNCGYVRADGLTHLTKITRLDNQNDDCCV